MNKSNIAFLENKKTRSKILMKEPSKFLGKIQSVGNTDKN